MSDIGSFDLITVYRGRDSATYLSKDFFELGDNATPIQISQYPGVDAPFQKIELKHIDALYGHNALTKEDIELGSGVWDVDNLKKLMPTNKILREDKDE